ESGGDLFQPRLDDRVHRADDRVDGNRGRAHRRWALHAAGDANRPSLVRRVAAGPARRALVRPAAAHLPYRPWFDLLPQRVLQAARLGAIRRRRLAGRNHPAAVASSRQQFCGVHSIRGCHWRPWGAQVLRTDMRRILVLLVFSLALIPGWASADDRLNVVTTIETLADLSQRVGGEKVTVQSLSHGYQDPHYVEAKPSLAVALHRADVLVRVGLDLEIGWLPILVTECRNGRVQPGQIGDIDTSTLIEELDIPT